MRKNTAILHIAGAAIGIALSIYVVYLLNSLLQNLSVISGADINKTPQIATFDLEKFQQIKKAQ